MRKLHLIGGEKGGVGKSFTARLLAQYHIDKQQKFSGFDSDRSHQTFSRFYGEFSTPINVDEFESLDSVLTSAENQPEYDLLVDLAAQTAERIHFWLDDCELFELMEDLGFATYLWHVMDDGVDSMYLLDELVERYSQDKVNIIAVLNEGRGEDFSAFKSSPTFHKAKEAGVRFLALTKLQSSIARKLDFNNISFWAAANTRHNISLAEQQRIRVWLKRQYQKLDECFRGPVNTHLITPVVTEKTLI